MGSALIASAAAFLLALSAAGDEFPVFVWCQDHAGKALPDELIEPFAGVNVEGSAPSEWVLENELDFYVGHAPGREVLHLQRDDAWYDALWKAFYESRDSSLLIREPCLSDPKTLEECQARLDRTLRSPSVSLARAVSLGDEVGLTPWGDPLDLCQSAACQSAWNAWNRTEKTAAWPTTDVARLAYSDGELAPVQAWLARRRFHQEVVLRFLKRLASHTRSLRQEAPIALFGLIGQTAFGGVSIPRVLPELDVIEAYSEGCARELVYTLRTHQDSWCTLFPAEGNFERGAHRLWEHWLRGGDGAIIWSDRNLKKHAGYLERVATAVRNVRKIHEQFPEWRPRPSRIAVVEHADSTALAWLRDALSDGPTWPRRFAGYQAKHGSREIALRGTLRLLEDCGHLPGALPLEKVGAETVSQFPVLVAVHQLIVSTGLEERLAAYLGAGGKLVLRGPFAILGEPGSARFAGAEQRLTEKFPGQVVRLATDEAGAFDYDEQRVEARDARVTKLRSEIRALTGEPHEWKIACETPLLLAEQRLPDGSLLCAAIPNLPTSEIPAVELTLETELEYELVFPQPQSAQASGAVRLRPGEAFVARLR